jgi:hypothetical protein
VLRAHGRDVRAGHRLRALAPLLCDGASRSFSTRALPRPPTLPLFTLAARSGGHDVVLAAQSIAGLMAAASAPGWRGSRQTGYGGVAPRLRTVAGGSSLQVPEGAISKIQSWSFPCG